MFEQVIANVSANFDPVVRIDFPRQYMRFFRWHRQTLLANEEALNICADCGGQGNQAIALKGSIGGFEIFGQGIPQRIVYLSQVANFGRLHWAGTPLRLVNGTVVADPDAPVSLQAKVRVGHDDSPATYHGYINIGRGEVSCEHYETLTAHLTRSHSANVPGGSWEAGSNAAAAGRIMDGNRETFGCTTQGNLG